MTEWNRKSGSKLVAVALALVLQASLLPAVAAPDTGSISGVVRADDGRQPLANAVVHIADRDSGKIFSSEPSAADGSFRVGNLPYGKYEVGVESDGGLFIVSVPLNVARASTDNVELVVTGSAEAVALVGGGRKAGTAGVWSNPLTASLIVVGAAIVVGAVISATDDDDEQDATPVN